MAPLWALCCGCPVTPTPPANGIPAIDPSGHATLATAAPLDLSTGEYQFTSLVRRPNDVAVFNLGTLNPGDRVIADIQHTSGDLDAVAAIFDANTELIAYNDDRTPDSSNVDPYIDFVLRAPAGPYYLGIISYPGGGSTGDFSADIRVDRGVGVPAPQNQILFLEWRGGQNVTIPNVGTYNLPVFSAAQVGLPSSQTAALKDRVEQIVKDRYSGFNLTVLSSDHDTVPTAAHSTCFFGGTDPQAFAVSEDIDSYNQDHADDSIVFTGSFLDAFTHQPSLEEMAQAMGNTVAHECGHLLGMVHTADCADLMDTSCANDRLLSPQEFDTGKLDSSVFPFGVQPERSLLTWILGTVGT